MEASDYRSGFYRRQSDTGSLKDWADDQDGVQEIVLSPSPLPYQNKKGLFRRQPTLTLITLEEDQNRIRSEMEDPPPYEDIVSDSRRPSSDLAKSMTISLPSAKSNRVAPQGRKVPPKDPCLMFKQMKHFLDKRPVLKLFLVIVVNGLVSMVFAAIFIELEAPAQLMRQKEKLDLHTQLKEVESNLTKLIRIRSKDSKKVMAEYVSLLEEFHALPDEIPWEMLSASAFVNSVSTSTGYGDIVPVTTEGKILTLVYALYGIPIFLWYIIKLGALFRVVVMRFLRNMADCCKATIDRIVDQKRSIKNEMSGLAITVTRPVLREEVPEIADTPNFIEELEKDKRFHPSIIGIILFIFLCSVASFISYMESMTYFDAFYACFITYSTIGFGDIDIYVRFLRSEYPILVLICCFSENILSVQLVQPDDLWQWCPCYWLHAFDCLDFIHFRKICRQKGAKKCYKINRKIKERSHKTYVLYLHF